MEMLFSQFLRNLFGGHQAQRNPLLEDDFGCYSKQVMEVDLVLWERLSLEQVFELDRIIIGAEVFFQISHVLVKLELILLSQSGIDA